MTSLCAVLGAACVSSSGTLQTAETAPKGRWQAGAGATLPVSTRFVREVVDQATEADDRLRDGSVTEEDEREAAKSALALLLFQPAVVTPLSLRRGIAEDVDVGLRMAGPALRIDSKWQFHRTSSGTAFALNAGASHHTGIGPSVARGLYDLFESLELVSYKRKDVDANLLVSSNPDSRLGVFGAARYAASFIALETRLDEDQAVLRDSSATMHLFGGSGGLRLGNQRFALLAELTIMRLLFEPELLGAKTDLSGWMVEPSIGVTATF